MMKNEFEGLNSTPSYQLSFPNGTVTDYFGYINKVDGEKVFGFVYNKKDLSTPQPIDVYINDVLKYKCTPGIFVKGIDENSDVCCGFVAQIPELSPNADAHKIDFKISGTEISLKNAPQYIKIEDISRKTWRENPPFYRTREENNFIIGAIDALSGRTLSGWAADSSNAHHVLWLELLVDEKREQIFQAGLHRQELAMLLGNPNHGYQVDIPERLFDGREHRIAVRVYGTETFLTDQPTTLYLPPPSEDAVREPDPRPGAANTLLDYVLSFPRVDRENGASLLFDEDAYLKNYPDVLAAVARGIFTSGYDHWIHVGRAEEERHQRDAKWRRVQNVAQLNRHLSLSQGDAVDLLHLGQMLQSAVNQLGVLAPVFTHRKSRSAQTTLVGAVTGFADGVVSGWLLDLQNRNQAPFVDLIVDGKAAGGALAFPAQSKPATDIGGYEFTILAPHPVFDGEEHDIVVVCRASGAILDNCPLRHRFGTAPVAPDAQALAVRSLPSPADAPSAAAPVSPIQFFDEERYQRLNPDIKAAIREGAFASGYAHWLKAGHREEEIGKRDGRWRQPADPTNHDVAAYTLTHRQAGDLARLGEILSRAASHLLSVPALQFAARSGVLEQADRIETFAHQPKISVVMPVYNVAAVWLRAAIESVIAQSYFNWELCIVDDNSSAPHIRPVLEHYAKVDPRIRVFFSPESGHISVTTNIGIKMATGQFIAFLDHDDEYTPNALYKIVELLNANPQLDYIYSDEDKIDEQGNVFGAFHKPDWSPELLLTYMYTCHLSVYRTALLRSLGGLRPEFDGAQDFDLALRFTEKTNQIGHIPEVLYHWRTLATSTAQTGTEAKDYAFKRAQKALAEHITRIGLRGTVLPGASLGMHRVRFEIVGEPRISIVIPTAGRSVTINGVTFRLIDNLIESIRTRSTYKNVEIIVIDNGDLHIDAIRKLDQFGVRRISYLKSKFNLAEKMNIGTHYATGDYLLIMNDDIEVITENWLEEMLQFAQQKGVAAVGPKLLFPDDSIQHAGVIMLNGCAGHSYYGAPRNEIGHAGVLAGPRNVLGVTGACVMTPAALFREFGGFDEVFDLNYNDVDYCLRLHAAGYRIVYTPFAELYHFESMSRDDTAGGVRKEEFDEFSSRWQKKYFHDPYYNVNLPNHTPYGFSRA